MAPDPQGPGLLSYRFPAPVTLVPWDPVDVVWPPWVHMLRSPHEPTKLKKKEREGGRTGKKKRLFLKMEIQDTSGTHLKEEDVACQV